jgi:magnesium chelatase family protein
MVFTIPSPTLVGLDTSTVQVEVDLRPGLPAFSMVGLPDAAAREARERVRSGLVNQAYSVPARRIVANLAPADLRKQGPQYDLAIALSILAASGQVPVAALEGVAAVGELGLDGAVRPVPGVLAMAEHASQRGWARLLVPHANAAEAALAGGDTEIVPVRDLRDAAETLCGRREPRRVVADASEPGDARVTVADLGDLRGQATARRALEIAAAGLHGCPASCRRFPHARRWR